MVTLKGRSGTEDVEKDIGPHRKIVCYEAHSPGLMPYTPGVPPSPLIKVFAFALPLGRRRPLSFLRGL
jgi:hypothetical protein